MNRPVTITAIAGVLIGLLVGFLWWGSGSQRAQADLTAARKTAEEAAQKLGDAEATAAKVQGEMKLLQSRLKALEEDLAREKALRSRLEGLVSQGKK
jgi:hypothetical protein